MSNFPLTPSHAYDKKVGNNISFEGDKINKKQNDNVIKSDTAIGNVQNFTGS